MAFWGNDLMRSCSHCLTYRQVLNLPIDMRLRKGNFLQPAVIPGSEMKARVQAAMKVLCEELQRLATKGMWVSIRGKNHIIQVRLLAFSADLPSTAKVMNGMSPRS